MRVPTRDIVRAPTMIRRIIHGIPYIYLKSLQGLFYLTSHIFGMSAIEMVVQQLNTTVENFCLVPSYTCVIKSVTTITIARDI
jgi:hypothetical protein